MTRRNAITASLVSAQALTLAQAARRAQLAAVAKAINPAQGGTRLAAIRKAVAALTPA